MIIYQTINLINGKKYIGRDKYNNPEYLGSGVILKKAIEKYGRENFKKVVLEQCKDEIELNKREKFWINKLDAVNSKKFYNIATGGTGGTGGDTLSNHPDHELLMENRRKIGMRPPSRKGATMSVESKKLISENNYNRKLTKEQYIEISNLYEIKIQNKRKYTYILLAQKYNVCKDTIGGIIRLNKNKNE